MWRCHAHHQGNRTRAIRWASSSGATDRYERERGEQRRKLGLRGRATLQEAGSGEQQGACAVQFNKALGRFLVRP